MERGNSVRGRSVADALDRVRKSQEGSIPPEVSAAYLKALRAGVARWLWLIDCAVAARGFEIPGRPATAPRARSAAARNQEPEPGESVESCNMIEALRDRLAEVAAAARDALADHEGQLLALHQRLELLEAAVPTMGFQVRPGAPPAMEETAGRGKGGPEASGRLEQLQAPAIAGPRRGGPVPCPGGGSKEAQDRADGPPGHKTRAESRSQRLGGILGVEAQALKLIDLDHGHGCGPAAIPATEFLAKAPGLEVTP